MKGSEGFASITMEPIGWVRNDVPELIHDWGGIVSTIEIKNEFVEGLEGIEDYSHIQVVFWLDRVTDEDRSRKKIHPRDRVDLPLVGIFATRTQYRPNPIGITLAKLLEREGNRLIVEGLDAIDGTPVLDLKPPSFRLDAADDLRVPEWVLRLGK